MKLKKLVALFLTALMLVASLAACGGRNDEIKAFDNRTEFPMIRQKRPTSPTTLYVK